MFCRFEPLVSGETVAPSQPSFRFAIDNVTSPDGRHVPEAESGRAARSERDLPPVSWNHILNGETVLAMVEPYIDVEIR